MSRMKRANGFIRRYGGSRRWEAPELEAEAEAGNHEAAGLVGEGELVIEEDQPAGPIAPVPHDEPRHRLHGKQAQPSLRPLREGGECSRQQMEYSQQMEDEMMVKLLQLQGMASWVKSETSRLEEGDMEHSEFQLLKAVVHEARRLEEELEAGEGQSEARARSLMEKVEQEVLQTRVIPLEEVRRDLDKWYEPFKMECDTLKAGPVTAISASDLDELKKHHEIERLPMKAVASEKPEKLKGRLVGLRELCRQPS